MKPVLKSSGDHCVELSDCDTATRSCYFGMEQRIVERSRTLCIDINLELNTLHQMVENDRPKIFFEGYLLFIVFLVCLHSLHFSGQPKHSIHVFTDELRPAFRIGRLAKSVCVLRVSVIFPCKLLVHQKYHWGCYLSSLFMLNDVCVYKSTSATRFPSVRLIIIYLISVQKFISSSSAYLELNVELPAETKLHVL